jgi:hypothetical protein
MVLTVRRGVHAVPQARSGCMRSSHASLDVRFAEIYVVECYVRFWPN